MWGAILNVVDPLNVAGAIVEAVAPKSNVFIHHHTSGLFLDTVSHDFTVDY